VKLDIGSAKLDIGKNREKHLHLEFVLFCGHSFDTVGAVSITRFLRNFTAKYLWSPDMLELCFFLFDRSS
jgi:hypothetical protein